MPRRSGERGQAMVEIALVLPILTLLVFGVADLAQAHSVALTIGAATREGARVAGALVNGGGPLGCGGGQSPNAASVDPQIVAAVERVLTASGTTVVVSDVTEIRIYKANSSGGEVSGAVSPFTYSLNGGPVVDGEPIDFVQQSGVDADGDGDIEGDEVGGAWSVCSRTNVIPADSAGVSILYVYRLRTPLRLVWPSLLIRERTVMALNASR